MVLIEEHSSKNIIQEEWYKRVDETKFEYLFW